MITIDYATENAVYLNVRSFKVETDDGVKKFYPFRKSGVDFRCQRNYWTNGDWVCHCAQFVNPEGREQDFLNAFKNWTLKFAKRFEEVMGRRPFEWDKSDRAFYTSLRRCFDFRAYRDFNPILIKRRGIIVERGKTSDSPSSVLILWENGSEDRINAQRLPNEINSLEQDCVFHALVEVDFNTGDAVGVAKVYWAKKKGDWDEKDFHLPYC